VKDSLGKHLKEIMETPIDDLQQKRYEKFRKMGIFEERK
jgi:acetyl-CoA carboxylase alpha subunit